MQVIFSTFSKIQDGRLYDAFIILLLFTKGMLLTIWPLVCFPDNEREACAGDPPLVTTQHQILV